MEISSIIATALSSALVCAACALTTLWLLPLWDLLVAKQLGELVDRYNRLSLDSQKLYFALRVWGLALISLFLTLWLGAKMLPVALVVTGIVYATPRHALDFLLRRRARLLRDQLVTATTRLGNAVKAGLSIAQGIDAVAQDTPAPLSAELKRITHDYNHGRPLREAIDAVRQRLNLEEFTLFALAIEVAIDRGGRINEALDRIGASLAEHQRVERRLEAETANGRRVVQILSCFPVIFMLLYLVAAPGLTGYLYSTLGGHLVLSAVIALVYLGYRYATHILSIDLR